MSYMTEERLMIKQTARDFTMKEVLPAANQLDKVKGEIPMDLRQKMADMGYSASASRWSTADSALACLNTSWSPRSSPAVG
jgi:alkylation response protein AidB-like acyl-CoA dehydrogenase